MWCWIFLACVRAPPAPAAEPADPILWVRGQLGQPVEAERVDWPFVALLLAAQGDPTSPEPDPSGLVALLASAPTPCVPTWSSGPGGADVTIPPPFDDDPPERIAAAEAVLAGLHGGIEVIAGCLRASECEEEPCYGTALDLPWAGFNVAHVDGRWQFRAWRDFSADVPPTW